MSPIPLAAHRGLRQESHHAGLSADVGPHARRSTDQPTATRWSDGAMLIDPGDIASARSGADQDRSAPWYPRAAARLSFGRPASPNARADSGSHAPTALAPGPDRSR